MEREDDIHDELKDIAPGFPAKKTMDPPQGYFETFPDRVLNRWSKKESQPAWNVKIWKRVIGIAAVLSGLCIGGWWLFSNSSTTQLHDITSAEAYQYINENINDFNSLIETGDMLTDEYQLDVPKEAVEQYLIEEMNGSNPEDLY